MSFGLRDALQQPPQRALLVRVSVPGEERCERSFFPAELEDMVQNLGMGVVGSRAVFAHEVQAKFFCGVGKAEEIREICEQVGADCLVFDNMFSPSQQREWEELVSLPVMDREEIILAIFAARARTREAVMQVDLARMQYALPRMVGMWMHLDRQRGGAGGGKGGSAAARGEGEKQIEVDRRSARARIGAIRAELETVRKQRATQRKERIRHGVPTAAIVGYTNAGKSCLLNRLTDAGVLVRDILFATLDTTSRRIELPDGQPLVLTDTVGFIRNLPHRLTEAFKSTLEEVAVADILLHVVDVSDEEVLQHYRVTCGVLAELGIEGKPTVVVGNKIDRLKEIERDAAVQKLRTVAGAAPCVAVSAEKGVGMNELTAACVELLSHRVTTACYRIPQAEACLLAVMHRDGKVQETEYEGNDILVKAVLPRELAARLERYKESQANK